MDEIMKFVSTFTGKVVAAIIIAFLIFLGSMAWIGMGAKAEAGIKANESRITQNEKDIKANAKSIRALDVDYRADMKEIRQCLLEINKKLSYNDGVRAATKK